MVAMRGSIMPEPFAMPPTLKVPCGVSTVIADFRKRIRRHDRARRVVRGAGPARGGRAGDAALHLRFNCTPITPVEATSTLRGASGARRRHRRHPDATACPALPVRVAQPLCDDDGADEPVRVRQVLARDDDRRRHRLVRGEHGRGRHCLIGGNDRPRSSGGASVAGYRPTLDAARDARGSEPGGT
jgi:hypothetical protein